MMLQRIGWAVFLLVAARTIAAAQDVPDAARVDWKWAEKVPLRDGIQLQAMVYRPKGQTAPAPCVFTLTPYIAQRYHKHGVYFAARGYPFLIVDVRGRGNSQGTFRPLIQEALDGYDVVEWLARQPYCNGKVAMWGGSYAGYNQWAAAKELPPHLATIVPAAAPYASIDLPGRSQILYTFDAQWVTFTAGVTSQDSVFADQAFWAAKQRQLFESGQPFKRFDAMVGNPSAIFQDWVSHPGAGAFWDAYNPTSAQLGKLAIPILTITGSHDDDQPGALEHYKQHMQHASPQARARHYLVIGPWDHSGTRTPQASFGGLSFGPASLVDLNKLHLDWYNFTMRNGPKPEFLQKRVAYYEMQSEKWRYADSLAAVTAKERAYNLDSEVNATDVLISGTLSESAAKGRPDQYVYDPRDVSLAALESTFDPSNLTDQRMVFARRGKQLVYHSAPLEADTPISGFFRFSAWIAIDQPDTDFIASVYEIRPDGSSIFLTSDLMRARYRESDREPKLVTTRDPLRYDFKRFTFVSRLVKKGSRLRLVFGPVNSIYSEKNFNSGGIVAEESMKDARPVTVTVFHDRARPATLWAPIGH